MIISWRAYDAPLQQWHAKITQVLKKLKLFDRNSNIIINLSVVLWNTLCYHVFTTVFIVGLLHQMLNSVHSGHSRLDAISNAQPLPLILPPSYYSQICVVKVD